jgi:hypothetical protein
MALNDRLVFEEGRHDEGAWLCRILRTTYTISLYAGFYLVLGDVGMVLQVPFLVVSMRVFTCPGHRHQALTISLYQGEFGTLRKPGH